MSDRVDEEELDGLAIVGGLVIVGELEGLAAIEGDGEFDG